MNELIIVPLHKKYTYSFGLAINKVLMEIGEDSFSYLEIVDFINNNLKYHTPFLLLINKNKVVGWCYIQPKDDITGILGMGILKEYRNKGYGKLLMTTLLKICKNKNYIFIEVQIKSYNLPAIKLCNFIGFSEYNRLRNFYKDKEDIIEMILNLEQLSINTV